MLSGNSTRQLGVSPKSPRSIQFDLHASRCTSQWVLLRVSILQLSLRFLRPVLVRDTTPPILQPTRTLPVSVCEGQGTRGLRRSGTTLLIEAAHVCLIGWPFLMLLALLPGHQPCESSNYPSLLDWVFGIAPPQPSFIRSLRMGNKVLSTRQSQAPSAKPGQDAVRAAGKTHIGRTAAS